MNSNPNSTLYVIWYIVLFFIIQLVCQMAAVIFVFAGSSQNAPLTAFMDKVTGTPLILALVASSLITIVAFGYLKYSPFSNQYLRSHPWGVVFWAAMLSLGTILPSEFLLERVEVQMPEAAEKIFESIMGKPEGYLVIGMLVPVAEEMVFRGAVLRRLLRMMPQVNHWVPIVISAILFGLVHGNLPQFIHAFIIGLLLGWMYSRTGSIVPGIVFHWVNNTVAFVMFNLMPQMNDGKLIDLFHGNRSLMVGGLLCSLCILLPSIFQLYRTMKPMESAKSDR